MGRYRSAVQDRLILPARVSLTQGTAEAIRLLGRPVPAPNPIHLLIDTGSKRSSLVPSILDHLKPAMAGRANVETSLGTGKSELFWVRLEFPATSLEAVPHLAVARLPMPPSLQDLQGVVGRDLLSVWDFLLYEGRHGRLTIRDVPRGLFGWFGKS
jgi:hypothetical protein